MIPVSEVAWETILLSGLNLMAVYVAAFVYALNWTGILIVMIVASVLTASTTHFMLVKSMPRVIRQLPEKMTMEEGSAILFVSMFTSLAILILLSYRFTLPMALGISLLSGVLSTWVRRLLAKA